MFYDDYNLCKEAFHMDTHKEVAKLFSAICEYEFWGGMIAKENTGKATGLQGACLLRMNSFFGFLKVFIFI